MLFSIQFILENLTVRNLNFINVSIGTSLPRLSANIWSKEIGHCLFHKDIT